MEPGQMKDGGASRSREAYPSMSVVIPTFNRAGDLSRALHAILAQNVVPSEIIVVDDSTNDETEKLLSSLSKDFAARGCELRYVRNPRERGVGIARNVGLELARYDIVQFTDDDVVLQPGFIESVLRVYSEHSDAVGVQGYLMTCPDTHDADSMYNTLRKMFCLSYSTHHGCKVLRSFKTTYPVGGSGAEPCEWMSGCSQSFRRSAVKGIKNDERMKRYSAGDDLDISYNVGRRAGGRLYLSHDALFEHREAQVARSSTNRMLYIDAVYSYYLFKKNVPRSTLNSLAFYWSRLGQTLLNLAEHFKSEPELGRAVGRFEIRHIFRSQLLWLSKRKEIASGELSFFEEYLKM